MTDVEQSFENFKVPQVFKPAQLDQEKNVLVDSSEIISGNNEEANVQKSKATEAKSRTRVDIPIPYKEPSWGGDPSGDCSLEIIKNGTFLEMFKLKSSVTVFGRLDMCDIKFEHPSVSRFHAIIQFCSGDPTHPKGFYLYDLGSTHGTFLNKDKITPKIYYKLKVGYILKFGGSSRLHIFQGPEDKEEVEEIKAAASPVEEVCGWGIRDDAEEEEDLNENPFALSTPNEELYLEDPKKTLRGWFEREGYELEYKVEEKGFKTFSCQIQLPIDTPTGDFMMIEASVSGKKKEAVVACALEACRTLDKLGLLRQSQQESRERRKKNWEENDYYDSDDDTFLDRTGTIEKKREMRMRTANKPKAETFDSLETKLKAVAEEISNINAKLSTEKSDTLNQNNTEDDSLEAYMSTLSDTNKTNDKIERRKLKNRLVEAEKEKRHLEKLLEIARPAKLPPALKYPGMIGKRPKSKLCTVPSKVKEGKKDIPILKENEEEVEEDSDDETGGSAKVTEITDSSQHQPLPSKDDLAPLNSVTGTKTVKHESPKPKKTEHFEDQQSCAATSNIKASHPDKTSGTITEGKEEPKAYGLILPKPKKSFDPRTKATNLSEDDKLGSKRKITEKEDQMSYFKDDDSPSPKKKKKNPAKADKFNDVYKTESDEYSTWVPPAGQSGDGMTHLNSKFGY